MGKLTNLNPATPIADSDIPSNIARDAEYIAADSAHVNATNPHPQYRQNALAQTFSSTVKAIGLSTGTVNGATSATINKSGIEVQAADNSSAAYISFHRPDLYGSHFGLDTNNTLAFGGWSFGSVSYKVWHEIYGTPVWQSPSDKKLKKSVRPILSGLEFILECQPVSFQYNSLLSSEHFADRFQRGKNHYGFLADDFPLQDLVAVKPNGYLGLDQLEIIPFLCRAIQEQQVQINDLKSQIELFNS